MDSARTEKGLFEASRKRSERWRKIAHESSQQARRVSGPEIVSAVPFARGVWLRKQADYRYFLDEGRLRRFILKACCRSHILAHGRRPCRGDDWARKAADRRIAAPERAADAGWSAGIAGAPGAACGNRRRGRAGRSWWRVAGWETSTIENCRGVRAFVRHPPYIILAGAVAHHRAAAAFAATGWLSATWGVMPCS